MISKKEDIMTTLNTIQDVSVFYFHPNTFNTMPCISYYEINNTEALHADDEEIISNLQYVIDIWNTCSTTSLTNQVNEKMKALGFKRIYCADMYEADTKIYRKHLKFSANF